MEKIVPEVLEWNPDNPVPPENVSPGLNEGGARKYVGNVATEYDARREEAPKWKNEQRIITGWLDELPEKTALMDIPVGTGRFIPYYEKRGFDWIGMDMSMDMLKESLKKKTRNDVGKLAHASVLDIPMAEKLADVSMMIRLTRWLEPHECVRALQELQRVTKSKIIITARVANHPFARPIKLIESALDGWEITRSEGADGEDYRKIMLEPV